MKTGLLETMKRAKTLSELDYLLHQGSKFTEASEKTKRKWYRAYSVVSARLKVK